LSELGDPKAGHLESLPVSINWMVEGCSIYWTSPLGRRPSVKGRSFSLMAKNLASDTVSPLNHGIIICEKVLQEMPAVKGYFRI
jgi:hypothetical protein